MTFLSLGLIEPLVQAASAQKFLEPRPIQEKVIPSILKGNDVWAAAETGSGKTAAFVLPLLQYIGERRLKDSHARRPVRGLILLPTRELAAQIGEVIAEFERFLPERLKVNVVFGGVSINPQMMALRGGADIVIGTPGRILDLIEHNALSLAGVEMLVLDEADKLLALGFSEELTKILSQLPKRRQNLLFSATFPEAVHNLVENILQNPVRVDLTTASPVPTIEQRAIEVDVDKRTPLLRHLLKQHGWESVLVFVAKKYSTEHIAGKLRGTGIEAKALHGELSQGARIQALGDFKAGRIQVLISTDVTARGIDISQLAAVVNYDLPRSPTDYLHRIGRTGRAGANGVAVSFVSASTHAHFRLIQKRNQLNIPREQLPGFEPTELEPEPLPSPSTGGIKGRRKSKKDKLREASDRSK